MSLFSCLSTAVVSLLMAGILNRRTDAYILWYFFISIIIVPQIFSSTVSMLLHFILYMLQVKKTSLENDHMMQINFQYVIKFMSHTFFAGGWFMCTACICNFFHNVYVYMLIFLYMILWNYYFVFIYKSKACIFICRMYTHIITIMSHIYWNPHVQFHCIKWWNAPSHVFHVLMWNVCHFYIRQWLSTCNLCVVWTIDN